LKQAKSPKKFVFHRREPGLQNETNNVVDAEALFGNDVVSISESLIVGTQLESREVTSLFIEASQVERVNLSNSSFGLIRLADVRFINCDLSNLETSALKMVRVEFINCRMTGFRAGKLEGQDVLISQGDQRYSQFRFSHFKSSEFDSCNFEDADFYGTDLSGARFRSCNLRNAELSKSKLIDADLRGSVVDGMQLNAEDIRGAVVDASQAMLFAPLLGIRIA
jgi:uncharacterized protein YjbI with pentapeptide repeats